MKLLFLCSVHQRGNSFKLTEHVYTGGETAYWIISSISLAQILTNCFEPTLSRSPVCCRATDKTKHFYQWLCTSFFFITTTVAFPSETVQISLVTFWEQMQTSWIRCWESKFIPPLWTEERKSSTAATRGQGQTGKSAGGLCSLVWIFGSTHTSGLQ